MYLSSHYLSGVTFEFHKSRKQCIVNSAHIVDSNGSFKLSFSPLNLNYTTYFVKVQIRSDVKSHAIHDTVFLPCALNWAKLVWTGHNLN